MTISGGSGYNGPLYPIGAQISQQVYPASGGVSSASTYVQNISECRLCAAMVRPSQEPTHTNFHARLGHPAPAYVSQMLAGPPGPKGPTGSSGVTAELHQLVKAVLEHMRSCDQVADDFMA